MSRKTKKNRVWGGKEKITNFIKIFLVITAPELREIHMNGGLFLVPIPTEVRKLHGGTDSINYLGFHVKTRFFHT
jgi:hypothetical protein